MDFYQAFRARLLAAPSLVDLVGTRIDWDERPQGDPLPSVTLLLVSDGDDETMEGPQQLRSPRAQVDVWAASRKSAAAIARALVDASTPSVIVNGIRFERTFVEARRDSFERSESGVTVFRTSLDLIVWHAPA